MMPVYLTGIDLVIRYEKVETRLKGGGEIYGIEIYLYTTYLYWAAISSYPKSYSCIIIMMKITLLQEIAKVSGQ